MQNKKEYLDVDLTETDFRQSPESIAEDLVWINTVKANPKSPEARAAASEFVAKHYESMLRTITGVVRTRERAEEIVGNVAEKVLRYFFTRYDEKKAVPLQGLRSYVKLVTKYADRDQQDISIFSPRKLSGFRTQINKARKALKDDHGISSPTSAEIAKFMRSETTSIATADNVETAMGQKGKTLLSTPLTANNENGTKTVADIVAGRDNPVENAIRKENIKRVRKAIKLLPDKRQRLIIEGMYLKNQTPKEICNNLKLSRERVYQLIRKAEMHLKKTLEHENFDDLKRRRHVTKRRAEIASWHDSAIKKGLFEKLPQREQQIINDYVVGCSKAQIAERIDRDEQTVPKAVERACKNLKYLTCTGKVRPKKKSVFHEMRKKEGSKRAVSYIELRRQGKTTKEIAEEQGVTKTAVQRRMKAELEKNGLKKNQIFECGSIQYQKERLENARKRAQAYLQLREQGLSNKQIAHRKGITEKAVHSAIARELKRQDESVKVS